jgi:hypothetical protein
MSFHVLELHWFHKNYELIQELNLKEYLYKIFGEEKTNILFHTINHPQINEILKVHNIEAQFKSKFEVEENNELNPKPEFMRIVADNFLNEIRSKLTKEAPFDIILKSCHQISTFDSLWFLPDIILRPEFIDNSKEIVERCIEEGCFYLYIKHLVFMMRNIQNGQENSNQMFSKIYQDFETLYLQNISSAAAKDSFKFGIMI